jgi:hypothetical protein
MQTKKKNDRKRRECIHYVHPILPNQQFSELYHSYVRICIDPQQHMQQTGTFKTDRPTLQLGPSNTRLMTAPGCQCSPYPLRIPDMCENHPGPARYALLFGQPARQGKCWQQRMGCDYIARIQLVLLVRARPIMERSYTHDFNEFCPQLPASTKVSDRTSQCDDHNPSKHRYIRSLTPASLLTLCTNVPYTHGGLVKQNFKS